MVIPEVSINLDKKPEISYLRRNSLPPDSEFRYRMNGVWGMHLYEGRCRLQIGRTHHRISPGEISFTPAEQPSLYRTGKTLNYSCVHIRTTGDQEPHRFPLFLSAGTQTDEIRDSMNRAISLFLPHPARAVLKIWDILWMIYGALPYWDEREDGFYGTVEKAESYMAASLRSIRYPRQVADHFGLSLNHLNRLFHREKGMTVGQFLLQMKMTQVRNQLETTDKPVKLIAYEVGISDLQYFNKLCHRYLGCSPRSLKGAGTGSLERCSIEGGTSSPCNSINVENIHI